MWRSRWAAVGAAVAVTLGAGGLVAVDAVSSEPSSFVSITPTRILDTRTGVGLAGPFVSGVSQKLQVTGTVATQPPAAAAPESALVVPVSATSVLLNVTVVQPISKGFLSIRPGDASGVPATSNINWAAGGANIANAVSVQLPVSGQVDIYVNGTVGHVLVDVAGYTVAAEAGPPGPPGPPGAPGQPGAPGPVNRIADDQIALLQWYRDPGAAATYPTGGGPRGLAFDGTNIWITNSASGTVSKMYPANGSRVDYPTGNSPWGVAFDGTNIWIANNGSGTVSKMNPTNGTRVDYPTGDWPRGVAFDGTSIWIANYASGTVWKMNPADGTRVDYPTGNNPQSVAFDGTNIWVTNNGSGTVSKMNPTNGTRVDYPTVDRPWGVAYDGTSIWITNLFANTVSKMNPVNGTRVDYATGDSPQGVAFDGINIWITNYLSDTVSKLIPG